MSDSKKTAGGLDEERVVLIDGSPVRLPNPREAKNHGIAVVYQDLQHWG